MSVTYEEIFKRLEYPAVTEVANEAQSWLENSAESELVPSLFQRMDRYNYDDASIAWEAEWLRNGPPRV